MQKTLIVAGIALVVLGGLFFVFRSRQTTPSQTTQTESIDSVDITTTAEDSETTAAEDEEGMKTVTIDATNFAFSVKEIKVKKGDTVKIVLNPQEGLHDWVVDEFDARTKQVAAGKSETMEFVADKAGTFEYYCSIGNHRKMGMVGKLIVE